MKIIRATILIITIIMLGFLLVGLTVAEDQEIGAVRIYPTAPMKVKGKLGLLLYSELPLFMA